MNKPQETSEKGLDKCINDLFKQHNIKLSATNDRDKRTKEIIKFVFKNNNIAKKDLVSIFVFKFRLSPKTIREDFINQLVAIKILNENAFGFITINDSPNGNEAVSE